MASQDSQIEYIVTEEEYKKAYDSLPESGKEQQVVTSAPIIARQYRQNKSQTINAGKWVMWNIGAESFDFTWTNGSWQPPANLVLKGSVTK